MNISLLSSNDTGLQNLNKLLIFLYRCIVFQLAMNKLWSNHLLLCKCTLSLSISFLGPTPESIRSWGDPTAPLDIITSFRAFTVNFRPPLTKDTPVADFPSK